MALNRLSFQAVQRGLRPFSQNFPFSTFPVCRLVGHFADNAQVDARQVFRPRTEFHRAVLCVKWKVRDVDRAGGFEDRRWHPRYFAVIAQAHLAKLFYLEII